MPLREQRPNCFTLLTGQRLPVVGWRNIVGDGRPINSAECPLKEVLVIRRWQLLSHPPKHPAVQLYAALENVAGAGNETLAFLHYLGIAHDPVAHRPGCRCRPVIEFIGIVVGNNVRKRKLASARKWAMSQEQLLPIKLHFKGTNRREGHAGEAEVRAQIFAGTLDPPFNNR